MAPITTIQIDRSAEDVFAYATEPTRFHEWQQGRVEVHMEAHGTPGVGRLVRLFGADPATPGSSTSAVRSTTSVIRGKY